MAKKIKVTQIRVGYIDLDRIEYPEGMTIEEIIELEKNNAYEDCEYMDYLDATEEFKFEVEGE